jgi:hypothetical protein
MLQQGCFLQARVFLEDEGEFPPAQSDGCPLGWRINLRMSPEHRTKLQRDIAENTRKEEVKIRFVAPPGGLASK